MKTPGLFVAWALLLPVFLSGFSAMAKSPPVKPAKSAPAAQASAKTMTVTITKRELSAAKNDLQTTLMDARVEPHFDGGKPAGFRFEDVAKDGIFFKLGFQVGDVLFEFNGKPVLDPISAMNIFSLEWARSADRANYKVRRGTAVHIVSVLVK